MSSAFDIRPALAEQVKAAREREILTQAEAAERLGVSVRTFQEWEAGRATPQPRHRRKLAEFCAVAA